MYTSEAAAFPAAGDKLFLARRAIRGKAMFELTMSEGHKLLDWMEWSASIVKAVAWPLAAIAISFIFRNQIGRLLDRIEELNWGDKKAKFGDKLDVAEETATIVQGQVTETPRESGSDAEIKFERLLAISPEAAILDAWHSIEMLLDTLLEEIPNIRATTMMSPTEKTRVLLRHGIISPSVFRTLVQLRDLRNQAAHLHNLKPVDAYRFQMLSKLMLFALNDHIDHPPETKREDPHGSNGS